MMPKISIIVPVFNTEKQLPLCIDSILMQTMPDFELIIVDDGSTDQSGIICDQYAVKDNRVKVLHKKNGGVSSARNLGIENACGEYITFIDSDDWVEPNYLEDFFPIEPYDFLTNYYVVHGWQEWVSCPTGNSTYDRCNFIDFLSGDFHRMDNMCSRLFLKKIIDEHNLRFNTLISYSEDILFVYTFIFYARTIKTIGNPVYHYIRQDSGTLSQAFNPWSTYEYIIKELCEVIHNLELKYSWDGSSMRSRVVRNHFNKFVREVQCGYNLSEGVEALRDSVKNHYVIENIGDSTTYHKSKARRLLDRLIQHRMLYTCVLLLKISYKLYKIKALVRRNNDKRNI